MHGNGELRPRIHRKEFALNRRPKRNEIALVPPSSSPSQHLVFGSRDKKPRHKARDCTIDRRPRVIYTANLLPCAWKTDSSMRVCICLFLICLSPTTPFGKMAPGARDSKAGVESTPVYVFHPLVPYRIKMVLPRAMFILLLRDPTER